ncbi:MAG: transposase, partial [Sphaerochaetaceae bacterium]
MVQIDASEHDWFNNGAKAHLHGAIDDATGRILALSFGEQETTETYFELMRQRNRDGQLPLALYSDKRGVFTNNRREYELTIEE